MIYRYNFFEIVRVHCTFLDSVVNVYLYNVEKNNAMVDPGNYLDLCPCRFTT